MPWMKDTLVVRITRRVLKKKKKKKKKKKNIALLGTIRGFFRYFRTNKPEGGRTIARTNLTKNEFL